MAVRRKLPLGEWLADTQRVAFDSAVFGMTGSSAKLPRRLYYGYLSMMQLLADVAGVEFDVLSLPTARELSLPDASALAITVSLGDPYVSFEVTSESSLIDSLLGGGAMQNVMVIGVLAAVAIPAYQDYTIRAQVSEGLGVAAPAKGFVSDYWRENGAFPDSQAAFGAPRTPGKYADEVVVFGDTGLIRVRYGGGEANTIIQGAYLYLQPYVDDDGLLQWECSSWLDDKYLPQACQGIEPPDAAGEANTMRRPAAGDTSG